MITKNTLSAICISIMAVIIALPTRSIEAYQQAPSKISDTTSISAPNLSGETYEPNSSAGLQATNETCHFGIGVVDDWSGYDLSTLGVGNYLDWLSYTDPSVPANIDYFRVINVDDREYPSYKEELPSFLSKNPGSLWIIGNEPDSAGTYQDHVSAETYASRFFELATIIRQDDPTAKIGFGPITQASPIRIYYLTVAMKRLAELAGGIAQAHALIDVYTIHGYIINEAELYGPDGKSISWGAGLPIGYDPATWPAPETIHTELGETYKTHDINIFKTRVINFRQWMADQGEQNKPLWITEFGSLFPSRGNPYFYVSDQDTATFMAQTFDFMLGTKDPQLGFAADDNRLVQKWVWFSMNHPLTSYGGALFDPSNHQITPVGQQFIQYNPPLDAVPVTNPDVYIVPGSLELTSFSDSPSLGQVYYKVNVKVSDYLSSDRHTGVRVDLFDGNKIIGTSQVDLPRCGGTAQASFLVKGLHPGESHNFSAQVNLLPGNGTDTNLGNNRLTFAQIALPLSTNTLTPVAFIPIVVQ